MSPNLRTDVPAMPTFLTEIHDLIHTHGHDNGEDGVEGVPLRLREAMKIALNEHPSRPIMMLSTSKRDMIQRAWDHLEQLALKKGLTRLFLTNWLVSADTDAVCALIKDALAEYEVRT